MIEYRVATLDDIPQLLDKLELIFDMSAATRYGVTTSRSALAKSLELTLNYPHLHTAVIAVDDGVIVGIAKGSLQKYFFSDDLMFGDHIIWVSPSKYGSNISDELLGRILSWAKENGAETASFSVLVGLNNDRANKFFEKHGFDCIGKEYGKRIL